MTILEAKGYHGIAALDKSPQVLPERNEVK